MRLYLRLVLMFCIGGGLTLMPGLRAQPVVRQLTVSDGPLTQYHVYSYDTGGKVIFERKQTEENGIRKNIEQTEWISSGDSLRLQRLWKWYDGKWEAVHVIRTRLENNKTVSEEHINIVNQVESLYRRMEVRMINGEQQRHYFQREGDQLNLYKVELLHHPTGATTLETQLFYSSGVQTGSLLTRSVRDSLGRLDSVVVEIPQTRYTLQETSLTTFFYGTSSDRLVSQVTRKWHPAARVWENDQRVDYRYWPDGQLKDETYSYFRELRWLATHRYSYEYYPDGVLKEKVLSGSIYRQWRKLSTVSYTDLSQGYPRSVRSTYNFWGGTTGSNVSTDLNFYFNGNQRIARAHSIDIQYLTPSAVEEVGLNGNPSNFVYPNPSDGILFMRDAGVWIGRWEVYDLQGRKLLAEQHSGPINRIDISSLPSGIYLLRVLTTDQKIYMQKITKK